MMKEALHVLYGTTPVGSLGYDRNLRVPSSACHDCSECLPCKVLS